MRTTRPEPEWDEEQRILVLEYLRWGRRLGPHGHPMDEATSPLADPANRAGQEYEYFCDLPIVDFAERAKAQAQANYAKGLGEGETMAGLIFPVEKRLVNRAPLL